jgi:hypothetical protein
LRFLWLALAATTFAPLPAGAIPLVVSSYSMNNGENGTYYYRDGTYQPCPDDDCNIDNAPLSGGTGQLTNGLLANWNWTALAGYGWVGWESNQGGLDPTVTFFFANTVTIASVSIWVDNTLDSVLSPAAVSIDGQNFAIAPDPTIGPIGYTFSNLNITGNSVDVQLFQAPGVATYLMLGQVSFDGSVSPVTPEPGTWALAAVGLGLVGWLSQRTNIRD